MGAFCMGLFVWGFFCMGTFFMGAFLEPFIVFKAKVARHVRIIHK
jgi:hypothetical protein